MGVYIVNGHWYLTDAVDRYLARLAKNSISKYEDKPKKYEIIFLSSYFFSLHRKSASWLTVYT